MPMRALLLVREECCKAGSKKVKTIKEHADEMRTMASMLNEAADALDGYQDNQMRGVLAALGLTAPLQMALGAAPPEPELSPTQKIRKEYAELPPAQRTQESRLYLARKYHTTEMRVAEIVQGPVQNGSLTRK